MINTILILILLAGVVYIAWRVVTRYRAAEGTIWERLLATAKGSATILWQYLTVVGGAVVAGLAYLADIVNMPEVSSGLKEWVKPEYAGMAMAAIAAISIWARLRTLKD